MNKFRRMCAVAIVTAALSVSAFAGIIDSPGEAVPAPTSSQTSTSTSTSTSMTVILTILSLIR